MFLFSKCEVDADMGFFKRGKFEDIACSKYRDALEKAFSAIVRSKINIANNLIKRVQLGQADAKFKLLVNFMKFDSPQFVPLLFEDGVSFLQYCIFYLFKL